MVEEKLGSTLNTTREKWEFIGKEQDRGCWWMENYQKEISGVRRDSD